MDFIDIEIDWLRIHSHLARMAIAYVLALPIGLNRQASSRGFGLRTFPLVAVVSCGFMLVGMSVIESTDGEARVFQGIITGIGFIGGGAIFKGKNNVTGMASAASLWNTGAIGLAVAFNRFEIAIALSLLNLVTLYLVGRLQKPVEEFSDNHRESDEDRD
jgi:putative Mg2+ transporter-C (MgtC) family protein